MITGNEGFMKDNTLDEAMGYFKKRDYDKALEFFQKMLPVSWFLIRQYEDITEICIFKFKT